MAGRLDGRVALVTGAARGIGAATASRLAADGASVALADLDESQAQETARQIDASGEHTLAIGCNVAESAQVQQMVERTLERFGRLDILVNNAGITRDNLLFKMGEDDWDAVIGVHLRGAFLCARAAQKPMVEQKYGRIVSLSSVSALGNRGQANYSAAKAGIQGLTRTLAVELGPVWHYRQRRRAWLHRYRYDTRHRRAAGADARAGAGERGDTHRSFVASASPARSHRSSRSSHRTTPAM